LCVQISEIFGADKKTLRRRLNVLLQPPGAVVSPFSANDFASFFDSKISAIRLSTATAGAPTVDPRDVTPLDTFGTAVTAEHVAASLRRAACKQCESDPVPTWLVKQCTDVLSPVIAFTINCSFGTATFPVSQLRNMRSSSHFSKSQTWINST